MVPRLKGASNMGRAFPQPNTVTPTTSKASTTNTSNNTRARHQRNSFPNRARIRKISILRKTRKDKALMDNPASRATALQIRTISKKATEA